MDNSAFIKEIRRLVSEDKVEEALAKMRAFLSDTPHYNEVLLQSSRFQHVRKEIRLDTITYSDASVTQNKIRFGLLDLISDIEQDGKKPLPDQLASGLYTHRRDPEAARPLWVDSLFEQFKSDHVAVSNRTGNILSHYGWLIEVNLIKMLTVPDDAPEHPPLRQLSFMAEVFQCSLRYLCYIQVAQLLTGKNIKVGHVPEVITGFLQLRGQGYLTFDYLELLFDATIFLNQTTAGSEAGKGFMPEIDDLVTELMNRDEQLCQTVLFLDNERRKLVEGKMNDNDPYLDHLLDQYLTGLMEWLRRLSFLARYKMASIKDINLNYRLGSPEKRYVHLYGELHGVYTQTTSLVQNPGEDPGGAMELTTKAIRDYFTYNQSVLLFRSKTVEDGMDALHDTSVYISLSPLVIDRSVFDNKITQTPEIYCFTGTDAGNRQIHYAEFRNELAQNGEHQSVASNKFMRIQAQNTKNARLNELYKHILQVLGPFNSARV